jgi:lysophospholipase
MAQAAGDAPLHPLAEGPAGGAAFWLRAADGVRLRSGFWPATGTAKGTVLIFPGRTEVIEKYGRTAGDLALRGYASFVIDWRGQGLADRLLPDPDIGHVGRFSDYQLDVAAMVAQAQGLGLPEPYFLLAHSMGGAIGLRALMNGLKVRAAAFSAPMWGIRFDPPVMRPVAWTVTALARWTGRQAALSPGQPGKSMIGTTPFDDNPLTEDPDQWAYMRDQILAEPRFGLGGPSLGWLGEAIRETRALAALPSPDVATVTFLGTAERIVDSGRIHARMQAWPRGALVELPGARHETLMETPARRDQVLGRITRLFGG